MCINIYFFISFILEPFLHVSENVPLIHWLQVNSKHMIKAGTFSVPLYYPRAVIQQKSLDWCCSLSSYKTGDSVIGCKTICRIRKEHDKEKGLRISRMQMGYTVEKSLGYKKCLNIQHSPLQKISKLEKQK